MRSFATSEGVLPLNESRLHPGGEDGPLAEAYEYIAQDSREAATRVLERLVAIVEHLEVGELQGPEVRLSDGRRVRRWSVPPYRIYYQRTSRRLAIVRVYHQARRPIEQSAP